MDVKSALKGQYHAGFAMLRECVERCPDDLWSENLPNHPRTFWRIAYHAIFFTHLYLMATEADFVPWDRHQPQGFVLWEDDEEGLPPQETTFSQSEMIEYLDWADAQVDAWVDRLPLDSPDSGFHWYKTVNKLDHQILNVRHLGIHVGQLQEHLYGRGIDLHWVTRRDGASPTNASV